MSYVYDENNRAYTTQTWTGMNGGGPGLASGPITITQDGVIESAGDALILQGSGYKIAVNGLVSSTGPGSSALYFQGSGSPSAINTISIGATGVVSAGYAGVRFDEAVNITNKGHIFGYNAIYSGNNIQTTTTITNSGTIIGEVNAITLLGSGKHVITNSGFIQGMIDLGNYESADTVKNTGTIIGMILLGPGDDTFMGGNQGETVQDQQGSDNYKLGGGDDIFYAFGAQHNLGTDKVDGGSNAPLNLKLGQIGDQYIAGDYLGSMAAGSVRINLDSKAHADEFFLTTLAANSALDVFSGGLDSVKNIESVLTGTGNDLVFGNASQNYISTSDGDDVAYGGLGDDMIACGSGQDHVCGGVGADILRANHANGAGDGVQDVFVYLSLKDSTVALSGRDTIFDFESDHDRIDLSRLGLTNNNYIGQNTTFSGVKGDAETMVIKTKEGWTIQVDANGDKKVDMAIDVADTGHFIVWHYTDFVF
ncbi:MAG: M10 family metallopeptidase C-terminal domain-containing protein [Hyphomicrobiales bacterium]